MVSAAVRQQRRFRQLKLEKLGERTRGAFFAAGGEEASLIKLAMSRELRVRDVMSSNVLTIPFSCTLAEAATLLFERGVSGAPVLGSNGRILGVVSHTDLVNPRHHAAVLDRASADNLAVAEAMTRVVFAVQPDDPLISAIRLMVDEKIHRVLVTDEHGKLAGIVVPMDILRELARHSAEPSDSVRYKYVDLRQ